ncbi:ATP-dependent Zn protease [Mesorhizobium sp. KR2-14]|uniref:ATP-dependent Zn protease n=1 Tax=Mesorhizobium sp. KR2-14 TaxID=3156610 RepID=UPI0032B3F44F
MAIDPTDRTSSITDQVLRKLARQTTGMSGAEIASLVNEARRTARREKRNITMADIDEALLQRKPPKSDDLKFLLAHHEAGHAVAQIHLDVGSINLLTINGANGAAYVAGSLEDFQDVLTEEALTCLLIIKLAGRAAEEELCGVTSTAAGGAYDSDLAQATRLACDLEMTLGFGAEHPLLYRKVDDPHAVLALNPTLAEPVHRRVKRASEHARILVLWQRRAIEYLADRLLEEETLEGETLEAAIQEVRNCIADNPVPARGQR